MSSLQQLVLPPSGLGGNVEAEFGVIPEAEGGSEPLLSLHHREMPATNQRQIKPRNIRTALKKLWLDEMLLTKQILCPVPGCTMVFSTLQGIQNHYQFCTGLNESGIVRCEFCGEQFLSQSLALEIHMAEEHRQEKIMSMTKADDIHPAIKMESPSKNSRKYREPSELIAIPPTPSPDLIHESRRRNTAFSRNQEELIDCEEIEGVVRFPLRNLPKGEQEDPLQLPAVMMNLDINLKPKPLCFDDLDENCLLDDSLMLSNSLMIKSEPIDKADDDPNYISNMIRKMPEPDLKTVPPARKRQRSHQQSNPGVRIFQVYMRSNSNEPNAAQTMLRDPSIMDAIVQQTIGQNGEPAKKKKRRKPSQPSVYVVSYNDSNVEQPTLSNVAREKPGIIKKAIQSKRKPVTVPPAGLVQVSSSLDQSSKYLQTNTIPDKPQVRQEIIDSFFNSTPASQPTSSTSTMNAPQPSTSFIEDSSQLAPAQANQAGTPQEFQSTEEFQTLQIVSSNDVLTHLGDQGCLIVPPEAFSQLEGAQLIVQDGQIIVQNKNGERVEGCQVVYSNQGYTEAPMTSQDFQNQPLSIMSTHPIMNAEAQTAGIEQQSNEQETTISDEVVIPQMDPSSGSDDIQSEMHVLQDAVPDTNEALLPMKDGLATQAVKGDADSTATQAAEALLTLRPQSRGISPLRDLLKDETCVDGSHEDDQVFHLLPQEPDDTQTGSDGQTQSSLTTDVDSNLVVVEDDKYSASA